jgi:hypothetical protein
MLTNAALFTDVELSDYVKCSTISKQRNSGDHTTLSYNTQAVTVARQTKGKTGKARM